MHVFSYSPNANINTLLCRLFELEFVNLSYLEPELRRPRLDARSRRPLDLDLDRDLSRSLRSTDPSIRSWLVRSLSRLGDFERSRLDERDLDLSILIFKQLPISKIKSFKITFKSNSIYEGESRATIDYSVIHGFKIAV